VANNLLVNGSSSSNSIYDQPWVMADGFAALKAEFEENYDCLGITCEDVGGLLMTDGSNSYYTGAEPCSDGSTESDSSLSGGAIAAIVVCALIFVAAVVVACYYKRRSDSNQESYKNMQEELKSLKDKYPNGSMPQAFEVSSSSN